jgi:hypothetical protein
MNMIGDPTHAETFAFVVPNNRGKVGVEVGAHQGIENGHTVLGAEHNMDEEKAQRSRHGCDYRSGLRPPRSIRTHTWGVAPRWYIAAPPALLVSTFALGVICIGMMSGCKSTPAPTTPTTPTPVLAQYPPRPTTPPPPFKLFHATNDSFTLVTTPTATDDQIEAIVWQLRDAAHAHTFDHLGIPQKVVDARDPMVWFHIYRGSKCASEKYAAGAPPCGASYHAAADYTFGGTPSNPQWDDGVILHDETHQTELWNPGH